jgi:hypothetical protein
MVISSRMAVSTDKDFGQLIYNEASMYNIVSIIICSGFINSVLKCQGQKQPLYHNNELYFQSKALLE